MTEPTAGEGGNNGRWCLERMQFVPKVVQKRNRNDEDDHHRQHQSDIEHPIAKRLALSNSTVSKHEIESMVKNKANQSIFADKL